MSSLGGGGWPPEPIKDPNTNSDTLAPDSPGDSISCLAWSSQNYLAAGSWDKSIRIWQVLNNGSAVSASLGARYEAEAPVLCCSFAGGGQQLVSGGCDQKVRLRDLQAGKDQELGLHDGPVKEVAVVDDLGLVASGSWDKSVRFWTSQQRAPALTLQLPERVYTMDVKSPLLVVGTADRHILAYDLRKVQQNPAPVQQRPSQLRMQTRCVSIFPDRSGFAIGSIEGRCGICYLNASSDNFTFKCHRTDASIYAVNSIDFHPQHGTFATAGSDGNFTFWDKGKRQRLARFNSCYYPITAGKFSADGGLYAYAVSYDWSQGHEVHLQDLPRQVLIHRCAEAEVTPHSRP